MDEFIALLQEHLDRLHGKRVFKIGCDLNKKWARIWTEGETTHAGKSVYMFVEVKTGDVYAPAAWSKRAKHVRGNISDPQDVLKKCRKFSMEYLRPHLNRNV